MKTYIADIIPRISKFSKQLDHLTLLTEQHWVALDAISGQKRVYIFRKSNELLVSSGGHVTKGKWEFVGKNSLLLELEKTAYLLKHGFLDENILALRVEVKKNMHFLLTNQTLTRR